MAKCKKCKKGWFFSKISSAGLCQKCEKLIELEKIQNKIEDLQEEEENLKKNLSITKKEILENIEDLKQKELRIKNNLETTEKDFLPKLENYKKRLNEEEEKIRESLDPIQKKLLKMRPFYKAIENSIVRNKNQNNYTEYNEKDLLENIKIAEEILELSPTIKIKLNCMDTRELKKLFNKNEQTIKTLLEQYKSRYTTKANSSIYSLMVIALESELQNVLYNLKYAKLDKSIEDIKILVNKYQKIATDGNQNIAPTIEKFIGEIEYLFIEAIKIEYEYYIQKERIKEEQRMLKEQMRQEMAEKKILEEQKKKIEQEEAKFLVELKNIMNLIKETQDVERIMQLEERFQKTKEKLSEVEKNKEEIIKLQNGKAGYVYIISNLGSFGHNVFKIGMTRRLDPQDRIDELGSASVPFRFDVHSVIFSEYAPELETAIHKRLHDKRVNKINLRKEFFICDIEDLENLVYELEPTASFNKTMLAEQFIQGISIDYIPDNIDINETELEED